MLGSINTFVYLSGMKETKTLTAQQLETVKHLIKTQKVTETEAIKSVIEAEKRVNAMSTDELFSL